MSKIITRLFLLFIFITAFFYKSKAQSGAALNFDGGSDYVIAPTFTYGSNWTAEAWAYPTSVSSSNWQVILGQAFWNNNQGFVIAIVSGTLFAEGPQGLHIETLISPNIWTHVALSYNNGVFAFYKDGILIGTQVAPYSDANTPTYIGCRNNNNNSGIGDYYQGTLDEIRLWTNTRSQCDLLTFQNCEIPGSATNLTANYHFNQGIAAGSNGTVTSLIDDSGNANTGTLSTFGLSGGSSNWISPGSVANGYTTSTIPTSEINVTGNGISILDGDISPSGSDFTDFGLSTTQTFVIESTGAGTLNAGIPFFTGANANQFSISVAPSQLLAASSGSTSFVITFTPTSPGTKTATVNIYNSDCSEPIYDFVITATALAAEALSFDGINDGISCPVFSALNSSITLQAKVNLSATTSSNQVIAYNGNTSNSGYGLFLQPGSNEVHVLYGGIIFLPTGYSLTLNQWTSLSLVLENNISLVYADGVLVSQFFIANPTIPAGSFMIGLNNFGTENFNGKIDEVLFWNKALSQCEIQTILNAEITSTASGLVANYHFNQGVPSGSNITETILIDAAGTNTATLSNFNLTGGSTSNWISPGALVSGFTTVTTPSVEINVQGNGNTILNGSISTSTIDFTDFGTSFTRTFVIQNTGTGVMNVAGTYLSGTNAPEFTISVLPNFTVGTSSSTSLVVAFTPTSVGSKTAIINFRSNDCDEGSFSFVIKANGTSSAIDLDGTSDWISTPIDADTDVMPNATWLVWAYPTSYPSSLQKILSIDDGGWDRFIGIYNNEIRASNGSTFVTVSTFTTNQWVHLAVVYKQSVNELLVYVNGLQYGPYTTSFANGTTANNLSISDATSPFQGKLDEVRIWQAARSQCEILSFKDSEVPNVATNLFANYHFNDGIAYGSNPTFTTLTDFSGNNNHGTLNTFSLSGANSNWINNGAVALGYTTASVPTATINVTGNGNNILVNGIPSLGNHTDFGAVSSRTFVIQNIGSGTLYINSPITFLGAALNDFSVTVPPAATLGVSGSSSFVVTFSPTALGTRSAIVSINSSDCTYPNYVFGIEAFGSPAEALSFDGINDYVNMPNIVNTFSNGIISGEAWVMTEATGGGFQSIIKNWGETNTGAFHFGLDNSSNYPEVVITQSNGTVVSVTDPNSLSTGVWYHLAFVADGNQLHLYKNGIEVGTPANYDGTLKTSFAPLFIGAKPNDLGTSTSTLNPGPWNGKIDELRLWTSARSQCQIQTFMNCEIPTSAIGLLANYHFNQGIPSGSNTAVNTLTSAAVAHTGTLTNFALTNTVSNWVNPGAIVSGYSLATVPSASINLSGNGNTITNGSSTPTTTNFTDFGTNTTSTFDIQNIHTGTSTLNVGPIYFSGANASEFSVSVLPSSAISANGSSNFVVTFTPTSVGSKSAVINIRSSDCTFPTYSFVISATATPASALSFDGTNDYVQIVDPNFGTSDFTLETWVNVNSFTINTYLMSTRTFEAGANGNYWNFGVSSSSGSVYFETADTGPAPYTFIGNSTSTISLSTWNHLAVVRSGLNVSLYVNGILKANATYTSIPSLITGNNSLRLSGSGANLALLNGSMDEVRIWNVARSQCQIQQFMNAEITSTASGLIANYHFNQGVPSGSNSAITSLSDAAGANTGTLNGFGLNGASSNWVSPGAVANGFTTFVVPTATLNVYGNGNLVPMGVTTSTANYTDFELASNRTFLVHNLGSSVLNVGNIYFTGTNASNFSVTSLPASTVAGSSNSPFIISFTPTSLSSQSTIVNITSNDCTNPTFSFVITASTSPASALDFDGVDDFVSLSSNTAIPVGNSPYCIEAWIKPNNFGSYGIIGWGNYSNTNQVNAFRLQPGGNLLNYWWGNDLMVSAPTLTNGLWHHVAATYDGTMRAIYIDGIMAGNDFPTGHNVPNNANMRIGCTGASLNEYFPGGIDEVRVWNTSRTQCEIQSFMNAEITSTASGLVANYHFNQGVPFGPNTGANVLLDAAGSFTGALTNFSLSGLTSNWVNPGGVISDFTNAIAPTASINVTGNGNPILPGSNTVSISNFTDFDVNSNRTFVVQNTNASASTLYINSPISISGSHASDFSVTSVPSASIGASANTSFVVSFSPTALGTRTAIISINSSDCSSPNYSFVISASASPASALNFDGINDHILIPNNSTSWNIGNNFTIESWIKPNTVAGTQLLLYTGYGCIDCPAWALSIGPESTCSFSGGTAGRIIFMATNKTTTNAVVQSTASPGTGVWTHVAVTGDGSTLRMYINGELHSSAPLTFSIPSSVYRNIGADPSTVFGCSIRYQYSGDMDELRFWNTARTQCEIQTYMNCEIPSTMSGLTSNYHFNQGIPFGTNTGTNVLLDAAGTFTGALTNFALTGTSSNWVSPSNIVNGFTTAVAPTATLNVTGNGNTIAAGSATTSLSNFTDFGNSSSRTFVLQNTGSGTLSVNTLTISGANASDFSITTLPSNAITNAANGTVVIVFIPASIGTKTAMVTINSSDCSSPNYSFMIGGTASNASALNFDGTNDFAARTVFNTQTNNITLQARVNWNGLDASNKFIAYNGNSGANGYGLYVAANSNSVYAIFGGINVFYTGCNLTANQWTALSLVIETNKISFYTNGVLTSTINTGINPSVPSGSFNVGVGINQGTENFNGSIDEVLLWTKALNACEIPFYLNCEIPTSSPSLAANYHFNQGIGGSINTTFTTVTDASGNNNTLSLGNFGLSGISSNWINPGAVISGSNCGVYSESEINVIGNSISIIDGATTPTLSNHTDFGNISSTGIIVRTFSIQNTGTSSLAITSISLSGVNATQFTVGALSPASPIASGSTAVFSVTYAPNIGGISSATLNISNNDCDESLFDFAITGSVTPGTSFSFDGNNDFINIGNILTSSYTKESWINISTSTNGNNILSSGSGTVGTALWAPGIYSYKLSAGHNLNWNAVQDPASLVPGTWYHVAVTYDAPSNIMTLYKNGALVATNTVIPFTGTDPLSIGAFSGSFVTTGFMDEVRIWNRPLCQAEIQNNMNCEIPTSAPGLIANYHFNQGIGYGSNATNSTVIDASGSSITGTITNAILSGTVSNWSSNTAITSGSSCPIYLTPEINLIGNNTSIVDGDLTPSLADHSDFAGICLNNSVVRTFTIQNTGNTTLTVSSMTIIGLNASDFSISALSSVSPINASNQAVFTVTFAPTSAGVKTATINIANSDCNEALYDFVITGTCNALPVVVANTSNSVICNTFSTSVFGTGADTYTWTGGVTNNTAFTPSISSSYTVNGTNTLTGCTSTNSAVQSITVNVTPTISAGSSNSVICFGNSSTLSAFGAASYTWEPGTINGTSVTITPSVSTNYSVTGTSSNGCVATNTAVLAITVNTLPVVSAATTDSVICLNFTTSLIGSGADTYTWTGNVTNGIAFTPTVTQTYTVNGTNTLTGCTSTNSAIQSITVNSLPSVTASTSNSIICEGFAATLTASGANTYTWFPGSLTGSIVSPFPSITSDFTLTGTSLEGCTNTNVAVQTISVNTIPTVSASISNSVICIGGTVSLSGSGASTYTWSNGIADNTAFTPSINSTFTVSGTNLAGCTNTNLATVSLTVNNLPVLSVSVLDSVLCFGDSTNLVASGALTYTWSGGISNGIDFTPSLTAQYTVLATDLNTCTNTAIANVTVNALPVLTISTTQDPACIAQTQTLSVSGALSYTWNTLASSPSITIAPIVATNYSLVALDLNGCVNTATFVQEVQVCEITVYSGVSANGDGINDVLTIQNIESYPQNKVTVYNRWGKEVFSMTGYNNRDKAWPLPEEANKLTPTTYFYIIDLGDGSKPTKGWVELIKN